MFFFLQPLKGFCLSLSPSCTKAIKSLEWKGQGASCASMEASKPCSDHPALQRGSNTRFRQDKRLPPHVTWPRETAFRESYRIPLCGMTVCSERWHLSNSLDQWSWFFVREKQLKGYLKKILRKAVSQIFGPAVKANSETELYPSMSECQR